MTNNGIGSFRPDMFKRLISLRQLNLSRNHLIKLGFDLPPLLHQLDISGNLLTEIDADFQLKLGLLPLLGLNVDNNPLQCDCPEVDFIEWFQQQNGLTDNHASVVCERGIQTYRINEINLSHLKLTCGLTLNKVVISISMCVLAFVLITSFGILYRFRWTLRWHYYSLRYKKRLRKQSILLGILNDDSEYSCYVIYPQESDKARRFVCETLLPEVEEKLQKPRLFIKDRDEVVGVPCLDEMVRAILSSQTAIWIVCPDFFVDPYCEMAARFALHHLGPRNNMLIVLEKKLENYSIPKKFVNMMNPIFGVAHVHFKEDGTARRFFSAKLDDFIPAFRSSAR